METTEPPLGSLRAETRRSDPARRAMSAQQKETTRIVYSIDRLSKRAEEQWVRLDQETNPVNFVGPTVAMEILVPIIVVSGIMAIILGDVPTAVVYLPMGLCNLGVLLLFELMLYVYRILVVAEMAHPLFRDNCVMILFVIAELTLVAQLAVYMLDTFRLVALHTDPSIDPTTWLRRYMNAFAGFSSVNLAVLTAVTVFCARPSDTAIQFLNLEVGDD